MNGAHEIEGSTRRFSFLMAGKATLTIQSRSTGARYTYKVCAPRKEGGAIDTDAKVRFVKVLTGSDNENDYRYAGFVRDSYFQHGGDKAKVGSDAPSVGAFAWLMRNLDSDKVSVWHEGSCGRCGRTLTVPESIESGLGPVCAARA